jgi:hypothetical protein
MVLLKKKTWVFFSDITFKLKTSDDKEMFFKATH